MSKSVKQGCDGCNNNRELLEEMLTELKRLTHHLIPLDAIENSPESTPPAKVKQKNVQNSSEKTPPAKAKQKHVQNSPESTSPAKVKQKQKPKPALPSLSERARDLYVQTKIANGNDEEGGTDKKYFLHKWEYLSEEKQNKWKKKAEKQTAASNSQGETFNPRQSKWKKPLKMSGFNLFMGERFKLRKPGMTNSETFKEISHVWRTLSETEKKKYRKRSEELFKEKMKEYDHQLASLTNEEREAIEEHQRNLAQQKKERKEIKSQSKETTNKQSSIHNYLDGRTPRKGKNSKDASSESEENSEDDDELSEEFDYMDSTMSSTSTPITSNKMRTGHSESLKTKEKTNDDEGKILAPKKKLKRSAEESEKEPERKKIKKDKHHKSSLETEKKQQEKIYTSLSESESDFEEENKSKFPKISLTKNKQKSKKDDHSLSDSDSGKTVDNSKSKKRKHSPKKSPKAAQKDISSSESESEDEKSKKIDKSFKKHTEKTISKSPIVDKNENRYDVCESDLADKSHSKAAKHKKEKTIKVSQKNSPKDMIVKKKKAESSSSEDESDSSDDKEAGKAQKNHVQEKSKNVSNPFAKQLMQESSDDSSSSSESEAETQKPPSPQKSRFTALKPKQSPSSSSSSDSDSD